MSETKREYWGKLLAEQEASGQKIRPFCRERGIGEHSFYLWRKRSVSTRTFCADACQRLFAGAILLLHLIVIEEVVIWGLRKGLVLRTETW